MLAVVAFVCLAGAVQDAQARVPSISEKTLGLERRSGLFPTYLDTRKGQVYVRFPAPAARGKCAEFLYVDSLRQGLGSNDVGLDRGRLGETHVVDVRRLGSRILFEAQNLGYRASSANPDEGIAVRESFASSVLWAGPVAAEDPDGAVLVDLTPFLVRDAHGVAGVLRNANQGSYRLDASRSALDPEACLAFPDNLEFEAVLTFATDGNPGRFVSSTTPEPASVTLVQHHSMIRLPGFGYTPRTDDPRMGMFSVSFFDYSTPIDQPVQKRWVARHRLEKTDPSAPVSPVKKPIVYYLDRGAPEPIRNALLEGARWWAEAFQEAGFQDAYRVELLPEGAHPLDVRYNVIQWVHRSTRGWSFGSSVVDPRTGEILKGHVTLGSLRVRQDRLLFEGLLGAERSGSGEFDDPVRLSLERLKQLSAHEVGHTLGFAHNFAASSYGRASVMDYPAPLVTVADDGTLDIARSYATGIGAWDKLAVKWAYGQPAPGTDERDFLAGVVADGIRGGMPYLGDRDGRSAGSAHPMASVWDNGADPVASLQEAVRVRRVALLRFGERNLRAGTPLGLLEETLVPVYLWHRYQVDAAAKLIGGVNYAYAVKGDGQVPTQPVPNDQQSRAIEALLACLEPDFLDLPDSVTRLLSPAPSGYGNAREMFPRDTGLVFDPLAAAGSAADIVLAALLHPERAARLVEQHRKDRNAPSLDGLLSRLADQQFGTVSNEIRRRVHQGVVDRIKLLVLEGSPAVRSAAENALVRLQERLASVRVNPSDPAEQAHARRLANEIKRFLERPTAEEMRPALPSVPPGAPIGAGVMGCGCH